jgi:hypothetical protein
MATGLRSESHRAAKIEIAKQIAIQLVKIARCLYDQRQLPLIDFVDQVLEKLGVVSIKVPMCRKIFKAALVDGPDNVTKS